MIRKTEIERENLQNDFRNLEMKENKLKETQTEIDNLKE